MYLEIVSPLYLAVFASVAVFLFITAKLIFKREYKKISCSLLLHGLTALFLVLALCQVRIHMHSKDVNTVFVIDVSDSMGSAKNQATDFVAQALQSLPAHNAAAVVAFGEKARVEQFMSESKRFRAVESSPGATATNIESAIYTALSMLEEEKGKRIVLLTDGIENQGDLLSAVPALKNTEAEIQIVHLQKENTAEVYIEDLKLPQRIHKGDLFSVEINVVSNVSGNAELYLYRGRTLAASQQISLESGENHFVFNDVHEQDSGLNTYRAVIVPESGKDTFNANNEYYAYTTVENAPKVLVIEGLPGNSSEFVKVLDAANINYDLVTTSGTPGTLEEMLEYASMILIDVYADDLHQNFMTHLPAYVGDYGGGIITTGGSNSYALGNYKDTPLEEVLPVSMDLKGEEEIPQMSMVMMIDHSGSMGDGDGYTTNLDLAKLAALNALENFRDTDKVGILGFDDAFSWFCEITDVSEREQIEDGIYRMNVDGGTNIYPALEEAVNVLEKDTSSIKHILLLTDGQDGYHAYEPLIERIHDLNITLSAVSIGDGADTMLLEQLADAGSGRYYHAAASAALPRIFAKEVFLSMKSYLVNRDFTPAVASNSPVITKPAEDGLPLLHGYVATSAKDTASVLLASDTDEPVIATWQYGLGRTVAFTTDVFNQWTKEYASWPPYVSLWKNLIESTFFHTDDETAAIHIEQKNGQPQVFYQTDQYSAGTKVSAIYTTADGERRELEFSLQRPGEYSTVLEDITAGVYVMNIRQEEDEKLIHSMNTAVVVPYAREYRFFEDYGVLESFARTVNAKVIETPEDVFMTSPEKVRSVQSLTPWFLFLALITWMSDITIRRLGLTKKKLPVSKVKKFIKSKKNIEKTQKGEYNKSDVILDAQQLLEKKKQRNSDR